MSQNIPNEPVRSMIDAVRERQAQRMKKREHPLLKAIALAEGWRDYPIPRTLEGRMLRRRVGYAVEASARVRLRCFLRRLP